ncbi:MAG TPA: helix-turn-helix domain-containing protein [Thermoflexales bacterium]|nr:helix-turn-helix domain-containing protein [Thermoflexales bacterium]HRA01252.1 helix-turn-helix domain-containing protein [Thermoflexales bacterium]
MTLNHQNSAEAASSHLMTVKDLAAYLSLDTTTIYRMVERGEIPVVRIGQRGRTVRFKREAIETWLKMREMNQITP